MSTHPYQYDERTDSGRLGRNSAPVVPPPLWWLVPGLVGLIALYAALPIVMMLDRDFLAASIVRNTPDLDPAWLHWAVDGAILYTAVLHTVDIALATWFVVKSLQGRRWARIALTVYLVLATVLGMISVAAGPEYYWAALGADAIHILMIVLLWAPRSSRSFFAVRGESVARRPGP
jgi:hypothetical protein